jgi:hypothetical protein
LPTATAIGASSCSTRPLANTSGIGARYGAAPDDTRRLYTSAAPPAKQFRAVTNVAISRDGFVYVCDRLSNRIQCFRKTDVRQRRLVSKESLGNGAAGASRFRPIRAAIHVRRRRFESSRDPADARHVAAGWHDGRGGRSARRFYAWFGRRGFARQSVYGETFQANAFRMFVQK